MVTLGVSFEGYTHVPLKRLANGRVIPDASVEELNRRHREYLEQQVEAGAVAEELGYEFVVHSEHHARIDGPVSPNPVLTHTAIARETEDVELLQMANILPWHDPVRLTEQLGMLDVLSDGRLNVGIGRGLSDPAGTTLGQYWAGSRSASDEAKNYRSFEEKYEILTGAWTDEFLRYQGHFHSVPPAYTTGDERQEEYLYLDDRTCEHDPETYLSVSDRSVRQTSVPVVPQPQQTPHPQLWKPVGSVRSATWAARRGMNVCLHLSDLDTLSELVSAYFDAARDAGWPDHRPEYDGVPFERAWDDDRNRGIGVVVPLMNTEVADEETVDRWKLAYERALANDEQLDLTESTDPPPVSVDVDDYLDTGLTPIHGDATELATQLDAIVEACGFEDAFFVAAIKNAGLTHEEHVDQLASLAEAVRPELQV
jgi:alkanesulfonate monooxygenase SsuD/methylene tetrahydromethanopterin reductase-like flavin-dependent oxidoreductase (luciferase family)